MAFHPTTSSTQPTTLFGYPWFMFLMLITNFPHPLFTHKQFNTFLQENGASSSGTNIRSTLIGMEFPPHLVDKAIKQNGSITLCDYGHQHHLWHKFLYLSNLGEENMDLLLETLFAYSVSCWNYTLSLYRYHQFLYFCNCVTHIFISI